MSPRRASIFFRDIAYDIMADAAPPEAFERDVSRYVDLDARIAALSEEMKELKRQHKDVTSVILTYMKDHSVKKCDTDVLSLSVCETVGQASLSVPLLKKVFDSFFVKRPELGDKLLKAIQEHRRDASSSRTRLKRVKKRA